MTERATLEKISGKVGRKIGEALPHGVGFALLVFDFGSGGNLAYISNAQRPDMVKAMREFLEKLEGGEVSPVEGS